MIARIQWIKDIIRRHGFIAAAILLNRFLRMRGLAATYKLVVHGKIYLWRSYIKRHSKWFKENKHHLDSIDDESPFAVPYVVIIGTLDLPQCKKYRVLQKSEQLSTLGIKSIVANVYDAPRTIDALQFASAVILYRLPQNHFVNYYIQEARRLSLPIGYDIDDPIFNREIYEKNRNLDFLAPSEKKQLLNSSRDYLSIMKQCDFVIVSTPKMKEVAENYVGVPIFIWRNVIDGETLHIISNLNIKKLDAESCFISLSYMSGSRAHELDFEQIVNPILRVMREFPELRLLIGGYAKLPKKFDSCQDRILTMPFMDYRGYLHFLENSDINLVPLVRDEFNDCKSAIRFLEASMMRKPTIMSNIGDFKNIVINQETGYLAETETEWYEAIKKLVQSKVLREKIGNAARDYVLANQTNNGIIANMDFRLQNLLIGKNGKAALNN